MQSNKVLQISLSWWGKTPIGGAKWQVGGAAAPPNCIGSSAPADNNPEAPRREETSAAEWLLVHRRGPKGQRSPVVRLTCLTPAGGGSTDRPALARRRSIEVCRTPFRGRGCNSRIGDALGGRIGGGECLSTYQRLASGARCCKQIMRLKVECCGEVRVRRRTAFRSWLFCGTMPRVRLSFAGGFLMERNDCFALISGLCCYSYLLVLYG